MGVDELPTSKLGIPTPKYQSYYHKACPRLFTDSNCTETRQSSSLSPSYPTASLLHQKTPILDPLDDSYKCYENIQADE